MAQKSTIFLGNFVGKFVAKNFQKSPKLVTLPGIHRQYNCYNKIMWIPNLQS